MSTYDFHNLSLSQQAILAAGGYRAGEKLAGRRHRYPTDASILSLLKRGFLHRSQGGAYAVPSEVAAAFRTHRAQLAARRARQDARRGGKA